MQLQRKLFLIIGVLTIVPLLVLQFGVVDRNERALETRVRQEVLGMLDKLVGELDTLLNAQEAMVRGLVAVPSVQRFAEVIAEPGADEVYRNRVEELQRFFLNYQAAVPSIQALRLLDNAGRTLVKVREHQVIEPVEHLADGRGYIVSHGLRPFFQQTAKRLLPGEVGISDFELGQVTPEAEFCPSMLRYMTPLASGEAHLGYLVVNVWGTHIDGVIARTLEGYTGQIMMAELSPANSARDGVYLYHHDPAKRFGDQLGTPERLSRDLGQALWRQIAAGPDRGSAELGTDMFLYRKFRPYRDRATQWLVVVQKDRKDFLGPVLQMRQTIWALVGLVVLLCLVLARWSAMRMARPVQHLADIITRYANGERVRYEDHRRDEIGRVGRAYNYLIDSLARAEKDRERAEAIACQAAKMATVGELAAGVAHEINNPLNNMMGLTELMERMVEDGADPRLLREDLEVLRQEQRRCADIVRGLLDVGRPKLPALTRVNLAAVLEDSIRLLRPRARSAAVSIELHAESALPPVDGDAGQLQQVAVNLLLNAIHASPREGTVQVFLEAAQPRWVRCRVVDEGDGVEEGQIHRIFEPFYTTKQDRQGTGLGLSVSYSIIQRHGGEMSAQPGVARGLVVWFTLPRAAVAEAQPASLDMQEVSGAAHA